MATCRDFEIIKTAGVGTVSVVFQVKLRKPEGICSRLYDEFALKRYEKKTLKAKGKELEPIMEKHCLSKLNVSEQYRRRLGSTLQQAAGSEDFLKKILVENDSERRKIAKQLESLCDNRLDSVEYLEEEEEEEGTKTDDAAQVGCVGKQNVVKLFCTFQSDAELFLLTEYCGEGELWEITHGLGILDEELAVFYAGQLVNALEYCHETGIVHRDLKAENLMLQENGMLKVIDFGSAVDLTRPDIKPAGNRISGVKGRKVFENFVGTPEFMAPETLKNESSQSLSDLWSLGCTLYQIIVGIPPFQGPSPFLTYILSSNVEMSFPEDISPEARDLITSLVRVNPESRIGSKGFEEIKRHAFFRNADLRRIQLKNCPRFPAIFHSCISHMSRNWERFEQRLVDSGWLSSKDKTLILPASRNSTESQIQKTPYYSTEYLINRRTRYVRMSEIPDWEKISVDERNWDLPLPPVGLELKARQLLSWRKALYHDGVVRALNRLLFIQKKLDCSTGTANGAFWEKKVNSFLSGH